MSGYLVQIGQSTGRLFSSSGIGLSFSGSGIPGRNSIYGVDYIFPSLSQLKHFRDIGFIRMRLPIKWERIQPVLNAALSTIELGYLLATLDTAAILNVGVIVEIHNSAFYNIGTDSSPNNQLIGSASVPNSAFADLWTRLATALNAHPALIGYELMNEPNYTSNPQWWQPAAQAAADAVRAIDTHSIIVVDGDGFASAANWTTKNNTLSVTDTTGNLYYGAHCWMDSDQSGNYAKTYAQELALDATLPTRGSQYIKVFADWCATKGVKGMIGETGWPPNDSNWDAVGTDAYTYAASRGLCCDYWAFGGINGSSAQVSIEPVSGVDATQTAVLRAKLPSLHRLIM